MALPPPFSAYSADREPGHRVAQASVQPVPEVQEIETEEGEPTAAAPAVVPGGRSRRFLRATHRCRTAVALSARSEPATWRRGVESTRHRRKVRNAGWSSDRESFFRPRPCPFPPSALPLPEDDLANSFQHHPLLVPLILPAARCHTLGDVFPRSPGSLELCLPPREPILQKLRQLRSPSLPPPPSHATLATKPTACDRCSVKTLSPDALDRLPLRGSESPFPFCAPSRPPRLHVPHRSDLHLPFTIRRRRPTAPRALLPPLRPPGPPLHLVLDILSSPTCTSSTCCPRTYDRRIVHCYDSSATIRQRSRR